MNASARSTGSVTGRSKRVHDLRRSCQIMPELSTIAVSAAVGVLEDRQQQREADALEDGEQHGERRPSPGSRRSLTSTIASMRLMALMRRYSRE